MSKITFRAVAQRYRICFPPETYGYAQGTRIMTDRAGKAFVDPDTGGPLMEQVSKPAAQFENGVLVLDDENPRHEVMILDLRRTKKDPALDTPDFWEEAPEITAAIAAQDGISLTLPKTLSDEDRRLIADLGKFFHNSIPQAAVKAVAAKFEDALVRFQVVGLKAPSAGRLSLLKGRVKELMCALEDAGVWSSEKDVAA